MKIFKRVFIVFLLIFSSQQIFARHTITKKELPNFFYEMGEDMVTIINIVQEISGENLEEQDVFLFFENVDKNLDKIMTKKMNKLREKFIDAIRYLNLEQSKLRFQLEELERTDMSDTRRIKEIAAGLEKTIDEIKPKNQRGVEKIQDLRNFIDLLKKFSELSQSMLKLDKKFEVFNSRLK